MKSIEMQIALPRTQDAGKMQGEQQQRFQVNQDLGAQVALKEAIQKEKAVTKEEAAEKSRLSKDSSSREQASDKQQKRKKHSDDEKFSHPFKGKNIDYSS